MSDVSAQAFREAAARITNYLGNGGLFNPELMEHDKVRQLLLDCREHVLAAAAQREQVDTLTSRVENLKFDMNLVAAQLGITNREEVEPVVRKLLADRDKARQQIATLTANCETLELKLAACTAAALGNTDRTVAERRQLATLTGCSR